MLDKWILLKKLRQSTDHFVREFRRHETLEDVFRVAVTLKPSPVNTVFQTAYRTFERLMGHRNPHSGDIDKRDHLRRVTIQVTREINEAINSEVLRLEKRMIFLATTASATPFIGLFGTVWGIMSAFKGIGITGSASLAVVAPGIAEALINTAAGLGAAIPALIGFNYLNNRIRVQTAVMERFSTQLLTIFENL